MKRRAPGKLRDAATIPAMAGGHTSPAAHRTDRRAGPLLSRLCAGMGGTRAIAPVHRRDRHGGARARLSAAREAPPAQAAQPRTRSSSHRRRRRSMKPRILAAALALGAITTTALTPIGVTPASAAMPVVDVKAIAQMLKQVKAATDQVTQLKAQLDAQTRMLNKITTDISPELSSILNDATSIMQSANGIGYNAKSLTSDLDRIYPQDLLGSSWDQITSQQQDWELRTRDTRREAMEAQNAIAQSQSRTQSAVSRAVSASQGADGQTAAIQATNQLLAALSTQLSGLQTLLITQMRAAETANAQRAAEQAASDALHKRAFGPQPTQPNYSF
ncbi:hypothetical protein HY78_29800 (plasmid) [Rhizorhabdus wittichii DC-6]|nr:hypothetical protein HY78_29800 [Rhizorhabdus wittichii DC-6]